MKLSYQQLHYETGGFRREKFFHKLIITPDLASQLLKHNTSNRALRKNKVKEYATEIVGSKWVRNGDSIRFDLKGTLINAQHTLTAVVQSGIQIVTNLETGLPEEAFATIDTGIKRSNADALSVLGVKNPSLVSQVIRYILIYEKGDISRINSLNPLSNQEVVDYYQNLDDNERIYLAHSVLAGKRYSRRHNHLLGAPIYSFLCTIFAKINHDQAETFLYLLSSGDGVGLTSHSSIYLLRNKLNVSKAHTLLTHYKFAYIFKAWNLFRENKQVKQLSWDDRQEFPELI